MGVKERFLKHHSDKIPAGETFLAVVFANPKGGVWRHALRAGSRGGTSAGGLVGGLIGSVVTEAISAKVDGAERGDSGAVASWPEAPAFWIVLTDKRMHVFGGKMNSNELGPDSANFPWESLAGVDIEKKMIVSKLNISFADETSLELEMGRQDLGPFLHAVRQRISAA